MDHHLTVGELRRALDGLSDDAPVFYERIEDAYFERHGWQPTLVDNPEHLLHPDQYIRAFTAVRRSDLDALYVTAHY